MMLMTEEYLTPEEVAERLKYHPEYVRKLLREEKLPGRKLRGSWRIKVTELDAWIKEQEQKETK
jgi:excisionase family DNA binding protein